MGAQLAKEVASKTNDVAGDGTTTATVLAQSMVNEGMKTVSSGVNPIEVKRGMLQASEAVTDFHSWIRQNYRWKRRDSTNCIYFSR